jgi:hypothetical protein
VAQVSDREFLPNNLEALSSNPSTIKTKVQVLPGVVAQAYNPNYLGGRNGGIIL